MTEIKQAYKRVDGTYVVDGYHVCPKDIDPIGKYDITEVESYLAEHPEALVPEPVPPPPSAEEKAASIRAQRDALLSSSDWTQVNDAPCDKAAWAVYRQALRSIPQQTGFPDSIIWPIAP